MTSKPKDRRYMRNIKLPGVLAVLCGACLLAWQALFPAGGLLAANTYDAAVDIPKNLVRTNDVAVSARHLLWKEGATPGTTAALCTAADIPLGTIDNIESSTGLAQKILRLGDGFTKMVASEAMATLDVNVYAAAGGKIALQGRVMVGKLRSVSGADGNVVLVESCFPRVAPNGATTKAGGTLAVPITHRQVNMTTGGAEALTLADGLPGQRLLLNLLTDGGDGTLTPTTKTGFTNIVFADAKDMAELEFVDSTVGWILVATQGAAATPPVYT